ncbi:flagellar basal body P-ring formation protein FlgA [Paracoccus limosus]|jgi:flagella basal body P-ring formation protein FlgA|uniref:Flagella basal body P-ring formation protein FlgA n=1 Tax=Paracoccus limosus TaxID=913252 RepID=A0A844H3W5_9RHOB|nr:flagellar basal body P-ring formation chaperone FlgA [Paracoccus limosus]MTH34244.1 flagellar basal body P-ring formation protein FlgA [Paracoccus limosus]
MRLILALLLLPAPALADAVVAAHTLRAGTLLTEADVVLVAGQAGGIADPAQVIGQQLRMMVSQGRPIEAAFLSAPTLVERNQIVTIAYERTSLRIEAEGRALGPGSIGQVIRVMNNSSRVTVSGRVAADGSVIIGEN